MAIDPRILLQRTTPDASGLAQNISGLGQRRRQTQATNQKTRNEASAEELLRLAPLANDPQKAAQAIQGSTVFDDADKKQLIESLSNPEMFQANVNKANRMLGIKAPQGKVLGEDEILVGPSGETLATGPKSQAVVPQLPEILTADLSPQLAEQGKAAFAAAGGGKDGMKAFTTAIDKGTEQERRIASPKLLKQSFPNASAPEMTQLQAAMDGAKTTDAGMTAAGKVRSEQRRLKKAKAFQGDAITLLQSIIKNPELENVLGSIEGAIDFRFDDAESELIADIEQAVNILTADNMDLMTGVLSESDIAILKSISGGGLNRKRTSKRFIGDVTTMLEKLGAVPVKTEDDKNPQVNIGRFKMRTL